MGESPQGPLSESCTPELLNSSLVASSPNQPLNRKSATLISAPMNPIQTLRRTDLLREQCLVGGQWTGGSSAFDVFDKATGEKLASVPDFGVEETKQAIDQDYKAFSTWRAKTTVQRSALLRKWFDLTTANAGEPFSQ